MEVLRSWSVPAILILALAAPGTGSRHNTDVDQEQALTASAFTNAGGGFKPWEALSLDISNGGDFFRGAYMGKVASSYTWSAKTFMNFGQDDVDMGKGVTPMKKELPCVIKVPCEEVWTGDGTHRTKELFFPRNEPQFSEVQVDEFGANIINQEESPAHVTWRKTQESISWAENDCQMANDLDQHGLPVVPCLYTSKWDAENPLNRKNFMFNVFEDYVSASVAWNEFVVGKTRKQIYEAFYSVMWYSLEAVNDLHKSGVEKIHHYLTLDSIALQFSQPAGEDGQHVSVKLTNFERMTSADFGAEPSLDKYLLAAVNGDTWEYYLGSPPESREIWENYLGLPPESRENTFRADHTQNPQAFDVFMLGCALLHMLTGSAPQDALFVALQDQYSKDKAPAGWEHLFFNDKGEYQNPSGEKWDPLFIAEAFHNWVGQHSTAENGRVEPKSLRERLDRFVKVNPNYFERQKWYPQLKPFFAPVLENVRQLDHNTKNMFVTASAPGSDFKDGVLNIIAKMMSFRPEARPLIQDILDKEMEPLQRILSNVK